MTRSIRSDYGTDGETADSRIAAVLQPRLTIPIRHRTALSYDTTAALNSDGIWDGWEVVHGLNPLVDDASGDTDHDGIINLDEFRNSAVAIIVTLEGTAAPPYDALDLKLNGHLAASCRDGAIASEIVYVPYGTRARFTLHRIETAQGNDSDSYSLHFYLDSDIGMPIPWVAAEGNSGKAGTLQPPFDLSSLKWEYVVPDLDRIQVVEGGGGNSATGPGNSPLNKAIVRAGEPVSLKAILSPELPPEFAGGDMSFITWEVYDLPAGDDDTDLDQLDGICDGIDLAPNAFSSDFSDQALGGKTTGTITDRGDRTFQIFDTGNPLEGVRIIVSGGSSPAVIATVGTSPETIVTIPAGESADFILTCGSTSIQMLQGRVEIEVQGVDTVITATLVEGAVIAFDQPDPYTIKINLPENSTTSVEVSINAEPPTTLASGWSMTVAFTSDIDGDGVLDGIDEYPNSDMRPTVVIGAEDTGVPNTLFPNGYTISDKIADLAAAAKNHGDFESAVTKLANDLRKQGVITQKQSSAIVSAATKSDIGK